MSYCVLVLEDQASLQGENKSLELATLCFANGHSTLLFDGREVAEVCASDPPNSKQLVAWDSEQSGYIDVDSFVQWFEQNCDGLVYVILIVDLKFGEDDDYGKRLFTQLGASTEFNGNVEPIVYSRWANDNRRDELMKAFALTDGARILNRDLDEYDEVFDAIRLIIRKYEFSTD